MYSSTRTLTVPENAFLTSHDDIVAASDAIASFTDAVCDVEAIRDEFLESDQTVGAFECLVDKFFEHAKEAFSTLSVCDDHAREDLISAVDDVNRPVVMDLIRAARNGVVFCAKDYCEYCVGDGMDVTAMRSIVRAHIAGICGYTR